MLRNGLLLYILHTRPKLWWNPVLRSGLLHTCPKQWCNPCSKCYGVDCFGTYFTHVQSCDVTRLQSATERTASVHASHMSKAVMIPVFKVPGNGLLRYILHTRPKLWCNRCSKFYGVDCFGTYTSHMSKAVMWPVFKVLWSGLLRYKYFTHVQSFAVTRVQSATEWTASHFTHVQSYDVTSVQSATEWTASVHASHMSKAVM